jgi:hypothetical protein
MEHEKLVYQPVIKELTDDEIEIIYHALSEMQGMALNAQSPKMDGSHVVNPDKLSHLVRTIRDTIIHSDVRLA